MTLYTFGDSLTYGWNFVDNVSEQHRKEMCWPHMLSTLMGVELKDYSFPGSSNWRTARLIQNLDLKSDDIVIVQLAGFDRMETGISPDYKYNSGITGKYEIIDKPIIENGILVKGMCKTFLAKTTDKIFKKYLYNAYSSMWNEKWHMEINKIMITSILSNLRYNKFIIFDGWVKNCYDNDFNETPQYILRGTHLLDYLKGDKYLTYGQQQQAAIFLEKEYNKLWTSNI